MSGAPVFMSGAPVFVAATQGLTLDCLTLVASGDCFPGFYGNVKIGETVLDRLPSLGNCTDSILKHITKLSVKEAYWLFLEL